MAGATHLRFRSPSSPRNDAGGAMRSLLAVLAISLLLGACTSVGAPTARQQAFDYGPPMQLRVCVLRAEGLSPERVDTLIAAVNDEFAPYGLEVVVPWVRPWQRTSFTHGDMLADVVGRELEPPCDRLVAFVDRHVGDFLWGLVMPEVLGGVDEATHTRGYIVATRASVNQLFTPPTKATVHEFYHLLGCPHSRDLTGCYARIAALKRQARAGTGFVPGVAPYGRFLATREEANGELRQAVARR